MATTPNDITRAAIASFAGCEDERLRTLLQSLVRHLHAFAAEVGLTQDEWAQTVGILTETGKITSDRRQEFVLWSDTLGVSMLVDALDSGQPPGATESTVLGPFYVPDAPWQEYGGDIGDGAVGEPTWLHGTVSDTAGRPIAGAEVDVWQNDADGLYAAQEDDAAEEHLRGRFRTREDGTYGLWAVRPVPYQIPHDGPVGRMLAATGRHPWRPAHIHLIVRAPGYRSVTTHIFDRESPWLDSDAVLAVKPSLLRDFVRRDPGDPERPPGCTRPDGPWTSVENDVVLAPA